ncbi:hypothetical protein ACFWN2_05275 [Lentzea sp. NPDC058436]|uniref:hypothetical protein n=1 Tax=Lentzea sp. NPDC058436 TaxID=3346499 RepID=UPI003650C43B
MARVLDRYFTAEKLSPERLAEELSRLTAPIHPNDHITAAALRAKRSRVRRTGRWLVRHGRNRQAVADALSRRPGGSDALLWLGARTAGWGRVHVVEALCRKQMPAVREWLLRHACDGSVFDGYYAGKVATAAHLHSAITSEDADEALVDHTGRLLHAMSDCEGMGMTLKAYPPAAAVVEAHAAHVSRLRTR